MFDAIYEKAFNNTVVSKNRCYILWQHAKQCLQLKGNFAECGVYKGGTAYIVSEVIKNSNKIFHLFDTFQGIPDFASDDPCWENPGNFNVSIDEVKIFLKDFDFLRYHRGLFSETLNFDDKFAFVHIDADLYLSTKQCINFFYPKMVQGGIIICDDYGFEGYEQSAKLAIDEFFKDKEEHVELLSTNQCLIKKL